MEEEVRLDSSRFEGTASKSLVFSDVLELLGFFFLGSEVTLKRMSQDSCSDDNVTLPISILTRSEKRELKFHSSYIQCELIYIHTGVCLWAEPWGEAALLGRPTDASSSLRQSAPLVTSPLNATSSLKSDLLELIGKRSKKQITGNVNRTHQTKNSIKSS